MLHSHIVDGSMYYFYGFLRSSAACLCDQLCSLDDDVDAIQAREDGGREGGLKADIYIHIYIYRRRKAAEENFIYGREKRSENQAKTKKMDEGG